MCVLIHVEQREAVGTGEATKKGMHEHVVHSDCCGCPVAACVICVFPLLNCEVRTRFPTYRYRYACVCPNGPKRLCQPQKHANHNFALQVLRVELEYMYRLGCGPRLHARQAESG